MNRVLRLILALWADLLASVLCATSRASEAVNSGWTFRLGDPSGVLAVDRATAAWRRHRPAAEVDHGREDSR